MAGRFLRGASQSHVAPAQAKAEVRDSMVLAAKTDNTID